MPSPQHEGCEWPPNVASVSAALDTYEVRSLISRDDQTAVYHGLQTNLNRTVTISLIAPALSAVATTISRVREWAASPHEIEITIHDVGDLRIDDEMSCVYVVADTACNLLSVATAERDREKSRIPLIVICSIVAMSVASFVVWKSSIRPYRDQLPQAEFGAWAVVPVADHVVTTLLDDESLDGSLRAILSKSTSGQIVSFDPLLNGGTLRLSGEPLVITEAVTIDASALHQRLRVDAAQQSQVIKIDGAKSVQLTHLQISGGRGTNGGGLACNDSEIVLSNCVIENCHATRAGGGIYSWKCDVQLESCVIRDNITENKGGGVANFGGTFLLSNCVICDNTSYGDRSAASMNVNFGTMHYVHSTVTGNTGGGVESDWRANLITENSIIWGNEGKHGDLHIWRHDEGPGFNPIGVNIVGDLQADVKSGPVPFSASPLFREELIQSERLPVPTAHSPAIDAAVVSDQTPPADIRGAARPIAATVRNKRPDLGAVEHTPDIQNNVSTEAQDSDANPSHDNQTD